MSKNDSSMHKKDKHCKTCPCENLLRHKDSDIAQLERQISFMSERLGKERKLKRDTLVKVVGLGLLAGTFLGMLFGLVVL